MLKVVVFVAIVVIVLLPGRRTTSAGIGQEEAAVGSDKSAFALALQTPNTSDSVAAAQQPALPAVPDGSALVDALKTAKEIYGREVTAAKTIEQKHSLAEKLLRAAKENEKDRNLQFVLLRLSRDIATQASESAEAFAAIDEIGRLFQIDALEFKAEALKKCAAAATALDQQEAVAVKAAELTDKAIVDGNFPIARQLNDLVLSEAKKAKDVPLAKQFSERGAEIVALANAYEAVKSSTALLRQSPNDAEANLTVGKYDCFIRGDWIHGLPRLASGNDLALKALADQETKGAASSEEQAKLGDAWWNAAEAAKGTERKQMQRRAEFWYTKAWPGVTALVKERVAIRIRRVIHINFDAPSALNNFVMRSSERGCCAVKNGNAILNGGIIYKDYFQSISSVTIRGGIVAPSYMNFRVLVGPVGMILNWEQHPQNLFWNGENPVQFTPTQPYALVQNVMAEIQLKQDGGNVLVSINGKPQYSTQTELRGTVMIYPANSTLMIHELTIVGIVDPDRVVTGPSHNNVN